MCLLRSLPVQVDIQIILDLLGHLTSDRTESGIGHSPGERSDESGIIRDAFHGEKLDRIVTAVNGGLRRWCHAGKGEGRNTMVRERCRVAGVNTDLGFNRESHLIAKVADVGSQRFLVYNASNISTVLQPT